MKFSLFVSDISKIDDIKNSLSFLLPNVDVKLVLNNICENDIIKINESKIKVVPYNTTTFIDVMQIENEYESILINQFLYYMYLLKNKIDFIVKFDFYDECVKLKNINNYKIIHYINYDYDYAIIINNKIHFIDIITYNMFFSKIKTINVNMFIRYIKLKQII